MKSMIVAASLAVCLAYSDSNRLSPDEARGYAKACVAQVGDLGDAQIPVNPNPEKPCAVRGEGGGAMVIPDRKLTGEKVRGPIKGVVPLGQLWLRKWTVVAGGKPVPDDRLRIVTVNLDDKDRPMPLLLLGLRQKGKKGLELVGYARGTAPVLVVPLKDLGVIQEEPLVLEWSRGEKRIDSLTLNILGKYQAVIPITAQKTK
jgi:hypothetical protein